MTHKVEVLQEAVAVLESGVRLVTYRRPAGSFFAGFNGFVAQYPIKKVLAMTQSESDGMMTLTIAYQPMNNIDE